MATFTIRGLDDEVRARLRLRAAENGRSVEAEVREILRTTVGISTAPGGWGDRLRARFVDLAADRTGDDELTLPDRKDMPPAAFEQC